MTKAFQSGLVVGKFCPLHRGHMLVIERAIAACDEVIVLSYTNPAFADCDAPTRLHWLRTLYPQVQAVVLDDGVLAQLCAEQGISPAPVLPPNDAPDAVQRDFVAWICVALLGKTVDAVFSSEDYGDGFAAALSAYFTRHGMSRPPVQHVCVDQARRQIPTSGTAIRACPHAHRDDLHPLVYASFVRRICLLGGESTGKTTLAAALAAQLHTTWVPEFGRELWVAQAGELAFDDLLRVARTQIAREDEMAQHAREWLVCDTSPLTTRCYSMAMFARVDPVLLALSARPYAYTFVCAPDFDFVQDGTRQDPAFRLRQHAWHLDTLRAAGLAYIVLSGSVAERLAQIGAVLQR
ncbi:AAA family ATPase [Massilia sp. CF038]|uniref:AAA family ATPase n=1 Tax=Massilia sp. CF038 TaxID=1881045 RepID=UPI00091CF1D3|nr:AAA family ATPase [Massilia sp. CF038]SHG64533.1 nicotinamide-nucleotide adenylyltransferase, NadR type [Massilia sp. CF038]